MLICKAYGNKIMDQNCKILTVHINNFTVKTFPPDNSPAVTRIFPYQRVKAVTPKIMNHTENELSPITKPFFLTFDAAPAG